MTTTDVPTAVDVVDAYMATWNEPDDAARAATVARIWAPDATYLDPTQVHTGHEGLTAMGADFQTAFPGHTMRRTTGIDQHHDALRFGWEAVAADGTVLVAGIDVALVVDGRLTGIAGFFGDPPAL